MPTRSSFKVTHGELGQLAGEKNCRHGNNLRFPLEWKSGEKAVKTFRVRANILSSQNSSKAFRGRQFRNRLKSKNTNEIRTATLTRCAKTAYDPPVIDKRPRHLHNLLVLGLVALEDLCVLQQVLVRMIDAQVELDALQQNALHRDNLLLFFCHHFVFFLFILCKK